MPHLYFESELTRKNIDKFAHLATFAEINIEQVQQTIDKLESELAKVRGKMATHLKEIRHE